jgi:hypothetical protein
MEPSYPLAEENMTRERIQMFNLSKWGCLNHGRGSSGRTAASSAPTVFRPLELDLKMPIVAVEILVDR